MHGDSRVCHVAERLFGCQCTSSWPELACGVGSGGFDVCSSRSRSAAVFAISCAAGAAAHLVSSPTALSMSPAEKRDTDLPSWGETSSHSSRILLLLASSSTGAGASARAGPEEEDTTVATPAATAGTARPARRAAVCIVICWSEAAEQLVQVRRTSQQPPIGSVDALLGVYVLAETLKTHPAGSNIGDS